MFLGLIKQQFYIEAAAKELDVAVPRVSGSSLF